MLWLTQAEVVSKVSTKSHWGLDASFPKPKALLQSNVPPVVEKCIGRMEFSPCRPTASLRFLEKLSVHSFIVWSLHAPAIVKCTAITYVQ